VEIYQCIVHDKQALKTIALKMLNLRSSKYRQVVIVLYIYNNEKLTGSHKTFDEATCGKSNYIKSKQPVTGVKLMFQVM